MSKLLTFFLLFLLCESLLAFEGLSSGKVLYKSTSEKTIAIDLGELDGFKEGDYGQILIQRGDYDRPTLFLIGLGKIVKTFSNKSIWLMEKNYISNKLVLDDPILIMLKSVVTRGRETSLRHKQIVFNKNEYSDVEDFLENNKNNVPKKFIANEDNFETSDDIFSDEKISEHDAEFATYDTFKNTGSLRVADEYNDQIKGLTYLVNKKYKIGDLKNAEDLKVLNSDARLMVNKYNSQILPLRNGLYRQQRKLVGSKDVNDQITITSSYEKAAEIERDKNQIDLKAVAKIKRDGELWSADMDDDTLRRYFITTGILKEKYRRAVSLNELDGHEVTISYAGNVTSHVVSPDVDPSFQMRGYHLNLGYDIHLSRTALNLKKFSVLLMVEQGVNYYDLNNINGRSQEGQYGAYLNYYFINNPLILNNFSWNVGVGVKFGMSKMGSDQISQKYDYQILTLPSFQLMTKYRFRAGDLNEDTLKVGMSVNAGIIYETKSLRIVDNPSDNITSAINVNDMKYQFGVSFYF
jgi:hypothetical protein